MADQARHNPSGSCYVAGCRRPECRDAERRYRRAWRARQRGIELVPDPPSEPDPIDDPLVGPVVAGVRAEIDAIPGAGSRPGLMAIAIRMGQILDDGRLVTTHRSAAKELRETLDELHKVRSGGRGRLAFVRSMTSTGPPA